MQLANITIKFKIFAYITSLRNFKYNEICQNLSIIKANHTLIDHIENICLLLIHYESLLLLIVFTIFTIFIQSTIILKITSYYNYHFIKYELI